MRLRKLDVHDAEYMLEWMHDTEITKYLSQNFKEKTLADCLAFIESAEHDTANLHMAIADETDTYMGTVSLKHINRETESCELAITLRKIATGRGFARFAIKEILEIAFSQLNLGTVYLNVYSENVRAVKCYEKCGFQRVDFEELSYMYGEREKPNSKYPLLWYRCDRNKR